MCVCVGTIMRADNLFLIFMEQETFPSYSCLVFCRDSCSLFLLIVETQQLWRPTLNLIFCVVKGEFIAIICSVCVCTSSIIITGLEKVASVWNSEVIIEEELLWLTSSIKHAVIHRTLKVSMNESQVSFVLADETKTSPNVWSRNR